MRPDIGDGLPPRIDVPIPVPLGTENRIYPFASTGALLPDLLPSAGVTVVPIDGAPHGLLWTHAAKFSSAVFAFLAD